MELVTELLINKLQALYGNLFSASYLNESTIEIWDNTLKKTDFTQQDVNYAIQQLIVAGSALPNFPQLYTLLKESHLRRKRKQQPLVEEEVKRTTCPLCEKNHGLLHVRLKDKPRLRIPYGCPHSPEKLKAILKKHGLMLDTGKK